MPCSSPKIRKKKKKQYKKCKKYKKRKKFVLSEKWFLAACGDAMYAAAGHYMSLQLTVITFHTSTLDPGRSVAEGGWENRMSI
jgi:hypothetical protein